MVNKFYNYLYDYIIREGFIKDKRSKDQKEKMIYVKEYIEKLGRIYDKYKKKVNVMRMLTCIYNKNLSNIDLIVEELKFLYEMD